MNKKNQHGFLLIVAVLLIVIISLFAGAIVYMFSGSARSGAKYLQSKQALYIAEAGLQRGVHALATPSSNSQHVACSDFAANPSKFQDAAFSEGTFTVTCQQYNPITPLTLNGNINQNQTITTLNLSGNPAAAGYAPQGRVYIGSEGFEYTGTSGNTLTGVSRGAGGTSPESHSSGDAVQQNLYQLSSTGKVGNIVGGAITNPVAEKTIVRGYNVTSGSTVWAVGVNGAIYTYDGTGWQQYQAPPTGDNYNAVSMLPDATDGWIVGEAAGGNFTILRWNTNANPDQFQTIQSLGINVQGASSDYITNLNSVKTVSTTDAWAVGDAVSVGKGKSGTDSFTIMHWNGSSWCLLGQAACDGKTISAPESAVEKLRAVDSLGNIGFAVGDNGTILKYNGTTWSEDSSGTNRNLNDVFLVNANEAYAVGDHGVMLKWNGSSWQNVNVGINNKISSIDMLVDNNGVATAGIATTQGNNQMLVFNGSNWSTASISGLNNQQDGILLSADEGWIVGPGSTTGGGSNKKICLYNGASVSCDSIGVAILGLAKSDTGSGKVTKYQWSEKIN